MAFSVLNSDLYASPSMRLTVNFNQNVDVASLAASDLLIDGAASATSANLLSARSAEFTFPALSAGTHTVAIAAGSLIDVTATPNDAFNRNVNVVTDVQFTIKHNPRLQPGNAPLKGFAGGELDRVDLLWQTIPGGVGTQDTFTVGYRLAGSTAPWQAASANANINTGVEGRVVKSASIVGLNWNTDYEYRVRQFRGDAIVAQHQHTFRTRLEAGDLSDFTFATYGDSANSDAAGFRQVQSRINAVNASFAVLLGDNVYPTGAHQQSDGRFDPLVNPEAAAWTATHIDYLGLGNHDVATGAGLPSEQNFSVPIPVAGVNAPFAPAATERKEHNFSWDYGDVHFVTFDTNSLKDPARLHSQLNYVVADLAASTAKWKIVYGHHPVAGTPDKPESAADNYYQQVVNRLKGAGADLFMTGHSHTYSWTYPLSGQVNGVETFVDHGDHDHFNAGEGLPQLVSGMGGIGIRPGEYDQFPFVAAGFTGTTPVASRLGFSRVRVTPTELTVDYVAADNGAVIDSFVIVDNSNDLTKSFQQGSNGYAGTADTFLQQSSPATNNGAATELNVDSDEPGGSDSDVQGLLVFRSLFGTGAGQIPYGAVLRSATLQLQVTNFGDSVNLHRMLKAWTPNSTWNSLTGGISSDGTEATLSPDASTGFLNSGVNKFDVLTSLKSWQSGASVNNGWAILPTGPNGVDFRSGNGALSPKLIVTYDLNTAPKLNAALNPTLTAIPEDATNPTGTLVSNLVAGAITDPDVGALPGIAVVTANNAFGTWQFSLNAGATWQAMGVPTSSAALLLPSNDDTRVRFLPKLDFNGTVRLYYRAWDRTQGAVGGTLNTTNNTGGVRSLSTANENATLRVTAVNDKPVLQLGGTLNYVRDTPEVAIVSGARVTDVDSANFANGRLRVRITDGSSAANILAIGGAFTVDGNNNVLLGGTNIGKRTFNGVGTTELIVVFTTDATKAIAQQLVRAITFKTSGGTAGLRKVIFTVSDGDNGLSTEVSKSINVT